MMIPQDKNNFSSEKEEQKTKMEGLPFNCSANNCFESFADKNSLDNHILISHTLKKPFICSYENCAKRYSTLGNLRYHKLLHSDNKTFKCPYEGCGKGYLTDSRLQIHLRTHSGERPFVCSVCGKGFNEGGNLKIHMRVHSGERPFKCSFNGCKQQFKAYGHLTDHLKRHKNIRPFKCDECPKTFARKNTLRNHKMTHTGEKPHGCPYPGCGKRFVEKGNMKTHIRTHKNFNFISNSLKISNGTIKTEENSFDKSNGEIEESDKKEPQYLKTNKEKHS